MSEAQRRPCTSQQSMGDVLLSLLAPPLGKVLEVRAWPCTGAHFKGRASGVV